MLRLGEGEDTVLHELLLAFGLRDDGIDQPSRLRNKKQLGQANNYSDENSKAPTDKWKVIKFDHFPKGTPTTFIRL